MTEFNYEKDSVGIVTVTMDMSGPVNAMNDEFYQAMTTAIEKLEAEKGLVGVVITSAKSTFFAGGDLKELKSIEPSTKETFFNGVRAAKVLLRRLEKLPVPVVSAINGAALGGGFEICLCCNYRIALDQKQVVVGLPEVGLGLMPGAGGVVRLTKLLGLQAALPFLLEGKWIGARDAQQAGLIHQVVDSLDALVPQAKAWIVKNKDNTNAALQPWDQQGYKIPGGTANDSLLIPVIQQVAVRLYKKTRGLLPAPESILNVAVEATRLDLDTALKVENRAFTTVAFTPQAKNMIAANFFQMNQVKGGASRPKDIDPSSVKKLGIIGAGMMGQGIAYVSAMAGIDVVLKDVSIAAAEKGKAYSATVLDKQINRGKVDESKKLTVLNLIKPTDKNEDLQGCDLIIEAVFENMALKKDIVSTNESLLAANGVWGSNTSTLPITQLAEASAKPENFIGIHFFSPVDKMRLVEIICGKNTSDETLARAFDFVRQIRKIPIVVKDSLGFFTSRVYGTPLSEAASMLAEGIHPVRIENMGKAIGMPVGPLTSFDEVSQRLSVDIMNTQIEMGLHDPADDPTPAGTRLIKAMVKEYGRGGRHHGGGFYEYTVNGKHIWPKLIELYYHPEVDISDEDIKDRLLFRPVIESLKCLETEVLRSVADGNIGSLLGIGAPTWTGGYIQFVNTYDVRCFVERCAELAAKYGQRFQAPAIAAAKANAGELFQ